MTYRRIFALSMVSLLAMAGCAESSSDTEKPSATCGNQKLDAGEVCDGTQFADGARACPAGTFGDITQITCSAECTLVTTVCQPTGTTTICNENDKRCVNGDEGSIEVCHANAWSKESCGDNKVCEKNACISKEDAVCNNDGKLDAGEDCDGEAFAEGKGVCPDDMEGAVKCDAGCQVNLDGCHAKSEEKCGNGEVDEGEDCDGTKFAEGKDVCPQDTEGTPVCDTTTCKIKADSCTAKGDPEEREFCNGDVYTYCVGEECETEDCTKKSQKCDPEKKACVSVYENKCKDNVLTVTSGSETITLNCTAEGGLCDEEKGECVQAPFTCDGSTLKLTDKEFTYDCKDNAKTEDAKDKILCDASIGCTDHACVDNKNVLCVGGECETMMDCSIVNGMKCAVDNPYFCVCESEVSGCVEHDGASWHYLCDANAYIEQQCNSTSTCDPKNGCSEIIGCGNGIIENEYNEKCEVIEGTTVWTTGVKEPTCNYYDKSKVFVSGAPKCHATKCTVDVSSCQEATDADYKEVRSWSIATDKEWNSAIKDKLITIHNVNNSGFKPSRYFDGGWQIGPWVSKSSANFDAYMQFQIGEIKDNTIKITLEIKRGKNGPKNIKLQYLNDSTVLGTSDAYELTEAVKTLDIVYKTDKTLSNFKFKLTGYNGDGTFTLSRVSVKSVKAL